MRHYDYVEARVEALLNVWPEFAPSVREKRKSSDSLADICMKQALGELGTLYLLFCQEPQHSLHASTLQKAHHSPLPPYFLGLRQKKTYLKWEFPQEVLSRSFDAQRHHSLHASTLQKAHHSPLPPYFLGLRQKKTYLKWEFPQEVLSKSFDAQRHH